MKPFGSKKEAETELSQNESKYRRIIEFLCRTLIAVLLGKFFLQYNFFKLKIMHKLMFDDALTMFLIYFAIGFLLIAVLAWVLEKLKTLQVV